MKAETLKVMLMSGKHDNLTVGEFAQLVRDADRIVNAAMATVDDLAKENMLNYGSLDREQEAPIGSNNFME